MNIKVTIKAIVEIIITFLSLFLLKRICTVLDLIDVASEKTRRTTEIAAKRRLISDSVII